MLVNRSQDLVVAQGDTLYTDNTKMRGGTCAFPSQYHPSQESTH